ncbi:hypothetical protein HN51_039601 [Arachis hypogaea]|uniref:uncharacterized GPI-anchored protein At5g19250 n=1 Tax=Arachis ipaensis TaxID=130454 RepID=UPI0007AFA5B9|nr:uncharacterized GPI-anchored protein At5g19250 [Arachis ipaensis]XP_025662535.1 uncharacterized GPI-anchored protein At5g19250 [Arachis hypogaea]QHN85185.1 putative GPI-anchored protein [Arachis hypogaea]
MASIKLGLLFLLPNLLLLSTPAHSSDKEEESVLKGINSFRQTQNLPTLNKVKKANCLADEIAEEIEDEPCENVNQFYPSTRTGAASSANIPNLQKHVDKCDIDINTTTDGVILPVCVSKLEPTVVLSNYTHSDRYARFLNNSRFTGVGLGSEDDWMVLVLTTNTSSGTFSASHAAATTSVLINHAVSMDLMFFALLFLLL